MATARKKQTPPPADSPEETGEAQEAVQETAQDAGGAVPPFDLKDFQSATAAAAMQAAALQSLANALTLTLHNAVAEQQHGHILRMALSTAASSAILNGKTKEAQEILELAKSSLVSPDMSGIMEQIKSFLDTIGKQLQEAPGAPGKKAAAS